MRALIYPIACPEFNAKVQGHKSAKKPHRPPSPPSRPSRDTFGHPPRDLLTFVKFMSLENKDVPVVEKQ
jgi:hypothetical protein